MVNARVSRVNPLTPIHDQHETSPYNIPTLSSKQFKRLLKPILGRSRYLDLPPNSLN